MVEQPAEDTRKIWRVSEITREIRMLLEDTLGTVWVEGELSNVRKPSSGHMYFTLKDERAQLSGVLFRGNQRGLKVEVEDGLKVRVFGELSVYEASGRYQIIVRRLEEAGKGSLQEAFEKLKKKLAAEGLFNEERKRALPLLPRHIGVVTSPTGAAIRDILNVLTRRFPNVHVVIAPAKVQGEGAAEEVVRGIALLNQRDDIDVMIVGRGGGSLEDLWCFNEEVVARAIVDSRIPVISAVGHEIDFTISDFVADLRAPTPSAAAELVVGQKLVFEETIARAGRRLSVALRHAALEMKNRLIAVARSYVFREPGNLIRQYTQRIDSLKSSMTHELVGGARDAKRTVESLGVRLAHEVALRRQSSVQILQRLVSQLRALSPNAVLSRGFSITRGPDGTILRTAESVKVGETLITRLSRGAVESKVTSKKGGG